MSTENQVKPANSKPGRKPKVTTVLPVVETTVLPVVETIVDQSVPNDSEVEKLLNEFENKGGVAPVVPASSSFDFQEPEDNKISETDVAPLEKRISASDILSGNIRGSIVQNDIIASDKPTKITVLKLFKIQQNNFRLGMEKSENKEQLMPGAGHTFVPFKKGDRFLTGLEGPQMAETKRRLSAILGKDLSDTSLYYEDLTFRMDDRPGGHMIVLDDTVVGAKHEVIYHCMLASSIIANGLIEYRNGTKPMAEWYIENTEGESEAKVAMIGTEIEAFRRFNELSDAAKSGVCKLIGIKAWGLSTSVIATTLWELLKTGSQRELNLNAKEAIVKFIKITDYDKNEFRVRVLVEDAIFFNVIRFDKARDYMYADEMIGTTKDDIVQRLLNPRNTHIRETIASKVTLNLN